MSTIVAKGVVKRRPGYMYFVDGKGNVGEAKMKKGGTKGAKRVSCSSLSKIAKKGAATRKKTATKRKPVAKKKVAKKSVARKVAAKKVAAKKTVKRKAAPKKRTARKTAKRK